MARHLWTAEGYRQAIVSKDVAQIFLGYTYYPPFLYWVTATWMLVFGKSLLVAVSVNGLWIALYASSIYAATRRLGTIRAGLLAVVFALTLPLIGSVSKDFQIDMPMTAVLALNFYSLLRTEYFRRFDWSVVYGITFGIGMLTKWSFIFAAPWPLLYVVFQTVRNKDAEALKNLFIAALVGNAVIGPWYYHNVGQLKIDFVDNGYRAGVREHDPAVMSLDGALYYPVALVRYYLHGPWLLAVVATIVAGFRRIKSLRGERILPLLLSVGTMITLTCLGNKDPRYLMPATLGIAIYVGIWLDRMIRTGWRWTALSLVGLMILSFLATAFFSTGFAPIGFGDSPFKVWDNAGYITGAPTHQDWCQEESVQQASQIGKKVAVEALDSIWYNQWGFQYYTLREGLTLAPPDEADVLIGSGDAPADVVWKCEQPNENMVWIVRLPAR